MFAFNGGVKIHDRVETSGCKGTPQSWDYVYVTLPSWGSAVYRTLGFLKQHIIVNRRCKIHR